MFLLILVDLSLDSFQDLTAAFNFLLLRWQLLLLIQLLQLVVQTILGLSFLIEFSQFLVHLFFLMFTQKITLGLKTGLTLFNTFGCVLLVLLLLLQLLLSLLAFSAQDFLHGSVVFRLFVLISVEVSDFIKFV